MQQAEHAPVRKCYTADRLQFYSLFAISLDFMWSSLLLQIRHKETSTVNKAEKNKEAFMQRANNPLQHVFIRRIVSHTQVNLT